MGQNKQNGCIFKWGCSNNIWIILHMLRVHLLLYDSIITVHIFMDRKLKTKNQFQYRVLTDFQPLWNVEHYILLALSLWWTLLRHTGMEYIQNT